MTDREGSGQAPGRWRGWIGRILRVHLGTGGIREEPLDPDLARRWLGGRGMGVALLEPRSGLDPLDPDMPVVLAAGPITGLPVPTSGRAAVVSRSPLTATVFDGSVGGNLGWSLKRAGYDAIWIEGRAPSPRILRILGGRVEIEDAEGLWGEGTVRVFDALGGRGRSVAAIGPAGERGVRMAAIVVDRHYAAGRGGLGAVLGSKRLKAIVVGGAGRIEVADRDGLLRAAADIMRLLKASAAVYGPLGLRAFGTPALVDLMHARRMMPTANFRRTYFPDAGRFSGYAMKRRYRTRKRGCAGCPILCKKRGEKGRAMPEFETASHLGALNENRELEAIVQANAVANDLGLDTISTASTIACHAEIESRAATGDELPALVRAIGLREGIGDALAEGARRYAEARGRPETAMAVKGLELPAYDPRGAYGMALAYATSNRGGCHLRAYPIAHEILRRPVATDRFSFAGKARIIALAEDRNAAIDSLAACKFAFFAATLEEYAHAVSAATGIAWSVTDLMRTGERIVVLERWINAENGFGRGDDDLPARFFREPGSSGHNIEIPPIAREDFEEALARYYRARGLDAEGRPRPETMERLEIPRAPREGSEAAS